MSSVLPELRGNEDLMVDRSPDEECLATWRIQATPGTTYWRCTIPARHLPGKTALLTEEEIALDEHDHYLLGEHRGSTAFWQFAGNVTRARAIDVQRFRGVRCFMEVDDNYLMPAPSLPNHKSTWDWQIDFEGLRNGHDPHTNQAHRMICKAVDGIVCATDVLADAYSRWNDRVFVCPNSIDPDDWDDPRYEQDDVLRIGYAGSISHYYDSFLVEPGLRDVASMDNVEVVKIGLRMNQWGFPHREILWLDGLSEYRKTLGLLDISLCPLKPGRWANCKSDIKALEAVMAGAIPIVQSDTPVYADWRDRTLSAHDKRTWTDAIKTAVSMSDDERQQLWASLFDWVMETKTIHQHIHKWRELIK